MTEARARELLGDAAIRGNGGLAKNLPFISWQVGDDSACLDDYFTADELEAIAWWMRNAPVALQEKPQP